MGERSSGGTMAFLTSQTMSKNKLSYLKAFELDSSQFIGIYMTYS